MSNVHGAKGQHSATSAIKSYLKNNSLSLAYWLGITQLALNVSN